MSPLLTLRPVGLKPRVILFPEAEARPDLVKPLRQVIFDHVERAMILCEGNRAVAASRLGICRATLFRYLERIRQERRL